MTPGISSHGPVLNPLEGLTRLLDTTAEEYLQALPNLTHDGIINIYGTSLGSVISFHLAALNLARNNYQKLNIGVIKLASPAAGARDVHENEKFNIDDASNQKYIRDVRNRFFLHMPQDAARMALRHPEKAGECMSVALIYSMDIGKHIPRLFTLVGNLKSAQQGIDWETMKYVSRSHKLKVIGGEDDPLMKEQLPQYLKLKELTQNVDIKILRNYGHALTLDSESVVRHLNEMEHAA
jgi:pimeloyl-ACP methyl ester carboxylesterase